MTSVETYLAMYSIAALLSVPLTYKWSELVISRLAKDIRRINAEQNFGFGADTEALAKEYFIPWKDGEMRRFAASLDMRPGEYPEVVNSSLKTPYMPKIVFLMHAIILSLVVIGLVFVFRFQAYRLPYGASLLLLVLLDTLVYGAMR